MLGTIIKAGRLRPNRLLYMLSPPRPNIQRFIEKPLLNDLPGREAGREQFIQRLTLLKGYLGRESELYACAAASQQSHEKFCEIYLTKLREAFISQDANKIESMTTRNGIKLNQFCIDNFGEGFPRTEELVQEGENLVLPYRPGVLNSLRKNTVGQYVKYYQGIEEFMAIFPWQVFIEHEKYNAHLATIADMYQQDDQLKKAINKSIYLRIKELTSEPTLSTPRLNLSPEQYKCSQVVLTLPLMNQIFEKLAVWSLLNDAYSFTHVAAYPGKLDLALTVKKLCTDIEFIYTVELEKQLSQPPNPVSHCASFFAEPSTAQTLPKESPHSNGIGGPPSLFK